MTVGMEPRSVRRGRVRMARGGRKGAKASIRVATYAARVRVDETLQSRASARARDRRNGAAEKKQRRPEEVRLKDKADRRERRKLAAARG